MAVTEQLPGSSQHRQLGTFNIYFHAIGGREFACRDHLVDADDFHPQIAGRRKRTRAPVASRSECSLASIVTDRGTDDVRISHVVKLEMPVDEVDVGRQRFKRDHPSLISNPRRRQ